MGKVDKERLGRSREKITPDDLEAEAAILTVAEYDEIELDDRVAPVVTFEELADKNLWLNKTQVGYLVDAFGDESDDFIGQQVVVEKKKGKFRNKEYEKVVIMDPEEWDDYLPKKTARKAPLRKKKITRGRK